MKMRRMRDIFITSLLLIIVGVLMVLIGCECGSAIDIVIENNTDQALTIYCGDSWNIGTLSTNEQVTIGVDANSGNWTIRALNTQGEVVFSQVYSLETNLQKTGGRTYKAVIPPLQEKSES